MIAVLCNKAAFVFAILWIVILNKEAIEANEKVLK
jgi:hypothetical protein